MNAIIQWLTKGSWKTTSTGLLAILGGIVRLVFVVKSGNVSEEAVMTILTTIVTGVGLLAARDNDKSSEDVKASPADKAVKDFTNPPASLGLLLLCGLLALGTGCRALAPQGVYKGDQILYNAELVIPTAYEVVHSYVSWEKQNRKALTKWPEIRQSADYMRTNYKKYHATANALRDAYAISPTDENRAALEQALSVLRAALIEASQYMAQASQPNN